MFFDRKLPLIQENLLNFLYENVATDVVCVPRAMVFFILFFRFRHILFDYIKPLVGLQIS